MHGFNGRPSGSGPIVREALAARLERLTFLDPVADVLQERIGKVLAEDTPAKDVVSGTWLGTRSTRR